MTNAKTERVEFATTMAARFRIGRHTFVGGSLVVTEAEAEPIRDFAATHPRFGITEVGRVEYQPPAVAPAPRVLDVSGPSTSIVEVEPVPEPEHKPRRRRRKDEE